MRFLNTPAPAFGPIGEPPADPILTAVRAFERDTDDAGWGRTPVRLLFDSAQTPGQDPGRLLRELHGLASAAARIVRPWSGLPQLNPADNATTDTTDDTYTGDDR